MILYKNENRHFTPIETNVNDSFTINVENGFVYVNGARESNTVTINVSDRFFFITDTIDTFKVIMNNDTELKFDIVDIVGSTDILHSYTSLVREYVTTEHIINNTHNIKNIIDGNFSEIRYNKTITEQLVASFINSSYDESKSVQIETLTTLLLDKLEPPINDYAKLGIEVLYTLDNTSVNNFFSINREDLFTTIETLVESKNIDLEKTILSLFENDFIESVKTLYSEEQHTVVLESKDNIITTNSYESTNSLYTQNSVSDNNIRINVTDSSFSLNDLKSSEYKTNVVYSNTTNNSHISILTKNDLTPKLLSDNLPISYERQVNEQEINTSLDVLEENFNVNDLKNLQVIPTVDVTYNNNIPTVYYKNEPNTSITLVTVTSEDVSLLSNNLVNLVSEDVINSLDIVVEQYNDSSIVNELTKDTFKQILQSTQTISETNEYVSEIKNITNNILDILYINNIDTKQKFFEKYVTNSHLTEKAFDILTDKNSVILDTLEELIVESKSLQNRIEDVTNIKLESTSSEEINDIVNLIVNNKSTFVDLLKYENVVSDFYDYMNSLEVTNEHNFEDIVSSRSINKKQVEEKVNTLQTYFEEFNSTLTLLGISTNVLIDVNPSERLITTLLSETVNEDRVIFDFIADKFFSNRDFLESVLVSFSTQPSINSFTLNNFNTLLISNLLQVNDSTSSKLNSFLNIKTAIQLNKTFMNLIERNSLNLNNIITELNTDTFDRTISESETIIDSTLFFNSLLEELNEINNVSKVSYDKMSPFINDTLTLVDTFINSYDFSKSSFEKLKENIFNNLTNFESKTDIINQTSLTDLERQDILSSVSTIRDIIRVTPTDTRNISETITEIQNTLKNNFSELINNNELTLVNTLDEIKNIVSGEVNLKDTIKEVSSIINVDAGTLTHNTATRLNNKLTFLESLLSSTQAIEHLKNDIVNTVDTGDFEISNVPISLLMDSERLNVLKNITNDVSVSNTFRTILFKTIGTLILERGLTSITPTTEVKHTNVTVTKSLSDIKEMYTNIVTPLNEIQNLISELSSEKAELRYRLTQTIGSKTKNKNLVTTTLESSENVTQEDIRVYQTINDLRQESVLKNTSYNKLLDNVNKRNENISLYTEQPVLIDIKSNETLDILTSKTDVREFDLETNTPIKKEFKFNSIQKVSTVLTGKGQLKYSHFSFITDISKPIDLTPTSKFELNEFVLENLVENLAVNTTRIFENNINPEIFLSEIITDEKTFENIVRELSVLQSTKEIIESQLEVKKENNELYDQEKLIKTNDNYFKVKSDIEDKLRNIFSEILTEETINNNLPEIPFDTQELTNNLQTYSLEKQVILNNIEKVILENIISDTTFEMNDLSVINMISNIVSTELLSTTEKSTFENLASIISVTNTLKENVENTFEGNIINSIMEINNPVDFHKLLKEVFVVNSETLTTPTETIVSELETSSNTLDIVALESINKLTNYARLTMNNISVETGFEEVQQTIQDILLRKELTIVNLTQDSTQLHFDSISDITLDRTTQDFILNALIEYETNEQFSNDLTTVLNNIENVEQIVEQYSLLGELFSNSNIVNSTIEELLNLSVINSIDTIDLQNTISTIKKISLAESLFNVLNVDKSLSNDNQQQNITTSKDINERIISLLTSKTDKVEDVDTLLDNKNTILESLFTIYDVINKTPESIINVTDLVNVKRENILTNTDTLIKNIETIRSIVESLDNVDSVVGTDFESLTINFEKVKSLLSTSDVNVSDFIFTETTLDNNNDLQKLLNSDTIRNVSELSTSVELLNQNKQTIESIIESILSSTSSDEISSELTETRERLNEIIIELDTNDLIDYAIELTTQSLVDNGVVVDTVNESLSERLSVVESLLTDSTTLNEIVKSTDDVSQPKKQIIESITENLKVKIESIKDSLEDLTKIESLIHSDIVSDLSVSELFTPVAFDDIQNTSTLIESIVEDQKENIFNIFSTEISELSESIKRFTASMSLEDNLQNILEEVVTNISSKTVSTFLKELDVSDTNFKNSILSTLDNTELTNKVETVISDIMSNNIELERVLTESFFNKINTSLTDINLLNSVLGNVEVFNDIETLVNKNNFDLDLLNDYIEVKKQEFNQTLQTARNSLFTETQNSISLSELQTLVDSDTLSLTNNNRVENIQEVQNLLNRVIETQMVVENYFTSVEYNHSFFDDMNITPEEISSLISLMSVSNETVNVSIEEQTNIIEQVLSSIFNKRIKGESIDSLLDTFDNGLSTYQDNLNMSTIDTRLAKVINDILSETASVFEVETTVTESDLSIEELLSAVSNTINIISEVELSVARRPKVNESVLSEMVSPSALDSTLSQLIEEQTVSLFEESSDFLEGINTKELFESLVLSKLNNTQVISVNVDTINTTSNLTDVKSLFDELIVKQIQLDTLVKTINNVDELSTVEDLELTKTFDTFVNKLSESSTDFQEVLQDITNNINTVNILENILQTKTNDVFEQDTVLTDKNTILNLLTQNLTYSMDSFEVLDNNLSTKRFNTQDIVQLLSEYKLSEEILDINDIQTFLNRVDLFTQLLSTTNISDITLMTQLEMFNTFIENINIDQLEVNSTFDYVTSIIESHSVKTEGTITELLDNINKNINPINVGIYSELIQKEGLVFENTTEGGIKLQMEMGVLQDTQKSLQDMIQEFIVTQGINNKEMFVMLSKFYNLIPELIDTYFISVRNRVDTVPSPVYEKLKVNKIENFYDARYMIRNKVFFEYLGYDDSYDGVIVIVEDFFLDRKRELYIYNTVWNIYEKELLRYILRVYSSLKEVNTVYNSKFYK